MDKLREIRKLEKTAKSFERSISLATRRFRKYQFYRRNKWLFYIPFNQIRYRWIMALWKNQETFIKELMDIHTMIMKHINRLTI